MTAYMQTKDGVVIDLITYPYDGYQAVEIDPEAIPENHLAGWWRWDGRWVFDQELYDQLYIPPEPVPEPGPNEYETYFAEVSGAIGSE